MMDPEATKEPRKLHAIVQLALDFLVEVAEIFDDFNRDEALNPVTILHWWRESWRSLRRKVSEDGIQRTLPRIILVVLFHPVLTSILWFVAFVGYVTFNILQLSRCIRSSSAYLGERRVKQHEAAFRQQFFLPSCTDSRKQKMKIASVSAAEMATTLEQNPSRFFALPTEIRREILVQAFGGRTMHMGLDFQHPFFITLFDRYGDSRIACHAKIERLVTVSDSHLRTDLPKEWVWFGCVCHRSSHRDVGGLRSHGAFRNPQPYVDADGPTLRTTQFNDTCEPKDDRCAEGTGRCKAWPGKWPDKCQIGAMGWLLTCKQAYVEGFNILYRTNTIHISSPALHRHMQSILTGSVLSHLTSLELVWDLDQTPIYEAFDSDEKMGKTGKVSKLKSASPLFPSMACLRFAFTKASAEAKCVGLDRHAINNREIKDILVYDLFPMIDNLLVRIVPNTTEVTISCPSWRWHSAVDLAIIDAQGAQVSKPQHAEIGGIKFWRQSNSRDATLDKRSDRSLEEATQSKERRLGFWIHSSDRPTPSAPRSGTLSVQEQGLEEEELRRVLYDEMDDPCRR